MKLWPHGFPVAYTEYAEILPDTRPQSLLRKLIISWASEITVTGVHNLAYYVAAAAVIRSNNQHYERGIRKRTTLLVLPKQ